MNARPLRVAFVVTQDRGGPVDVCVRLASRLAADGLQVRVFGPVPARGDETLAGCWEAVAASSKSDLRSGQRVRAALRAWAPDVVHAQDRRAGLVVAPLRGLPRVHTYHGVPEDVSQRWFAGVPGALPPSRYTRLTLAADAVLARAIDRTVVPSPSMARFLAQRLRVPVRRLLHVDNGLPLPVPPPPVPGPVRHLVFVGILLRRKGVLDLLDALARPGVFPADARLTVVGDGPERAGVERAVAAGPLHGRVHMAGFRTDVDRLIAGADAVVVPSRMEQQPLVVIEAMAAGRPVVATRTGDVSRMLEVPGGARLLADPGDVAGLADALRALFADPDPVRIGTLLAARAAELFDVAGSARAHRALYAALTGAPREPLHAVG